MQECQTLFPLRLIRCFGGSTHKYENDLKLRIMAYQVAAAYEADVEHAHLAVISISNVKNHQGKHYKCESGYAHSGVDLPNEID
jgi:hypothetical protein